MKYDRSSYALCTYIYVNMKCTPQRLNVVAAFFYESRWEFSGRYQRRVLLKLLDFLELIFLVGVERMVDRYEAKSYLSKCIACFLFFIFYF